MQSLRQEARSGERKVSFNKQKPKSTKKTKNKKHELPRTRNQSNKETARQSGKIKQLKVQRKKFKSNIGKPEI